MTIRFSSFLSVSNIWIEFTSVSMRFALWLASSISPSAKEWSQYLIWSSSMDGLFMLSTAILAVIRSLSSSSSASRFLIEGENEPSSIATVMFLILYHYF